MGLRLLILERWTPNFIIRRELSKVSIQTTEALKTLLSAYATQQPIEKSNSKKHTSIQEQREKMAQNHTKMVEALEVAVGREKAVALGREAMFAVGVNLGKQTRSKLGVGDNPNDLVRAAKILYRILGIEFHMGNLTQDKAEVIIDRCALAQQYSRLTCEVLSATDEGVIKGLQPNAAMQFKKYITSGRQTCTAHIQFTKEAMA
jgi:predicted ArsR family transcriptional regulator